MSEPTSGRVQSGDDKPEWWSWPMRDWQFHLFGLIPMGPIAVSSKTPPKPGPFWRWFGIVRSVPRTNR